jgi:hypothetical protein
VVESNLLRRRPNMPENSTPLSTPTTEVWKPVPGYEGLYEVSDRGEVRSIARRALITVQRSRRYLTVCLYKDSRRKRHYVHAVVASAFIGERPAGHEVNHRDGDHLNNRADNLEYLTRSQNIRHAQRTLGSYRGERHPLSKLTEADIIEIRRTTKRNRKDYDRVALSYGIAWGTVRNIMRGKSWRHVNANG